MCNFITVAYPSGTAVPIKINYTIELVDDVQTINCSVADSHVPLWLQLKKFSMSSIKLQGAYNPLFMEINNSRNMDTTLFIDLVYSSIMNVERLKIFNTAKN